MYLAGKQFGHIPHLLVKQTRALFQHLQTLSQQKHTFPCLISLRIMPRNRSAVQRPQRSPSRSSSSAGPQPPTRLFSRKESPSKNVHFSRNLIMGPHDPARRSQSPMRPALHGSGGAADSPSIQLRQEQAGGRTTGRGRNGRDGRTAAARRGTSSNNPRQYLFLTRLTRR